MNVWDPDELTALQQAFETIGLELEEEGQVESHDKAMRDWVSARVFECAESGCRDLEGLKQSVQSILTI